MRFMLFEVGRGEYCGRDEIEVNDLRSPDLDATALDILE